MCVCVCVCHPLILSGSWAGADREQSSWSLKRVSRNYTLHKGNIFAPEGQKTGYKRKRQEIEDEGEGDSIFILVRGVRKATKDCLWLERQQMWPIGKRWFIKIKGETPS